jgi:hypothetical protein
MNINSGVGQDTSALSFQKSTIPQGMQNQAPGQPGAL